MFIHINKLLFWQYYSEHNVLCDYIGWGLNPERTNDCPSHEPLPSNAHDMISQHILTKSYMRLVFYNLTFLTQSLINSYYVSLFVQKPGL